MRKSRRRVAAAVALLGAALVAQRILEAPPPVTPAPATPPAAAGDGETPVAATALSEPEQLWSEAAPELPVMGFDGRVISSTTGLGVAGAEVTLSHGGVAHSFLADAHGHFHFDPAAPGRYDVRAVAARGFWPLMAEARGDSITLMARPGRVVRDVVLSLDPDEPLRTTVLDPQGHAVAGARVAVHDGNGFALQAGDSDAHGVLMVHAPPEAVVEARHSRWSPGRAVVDEWARSTGLLEIRLGEPGDGQPPPGSIAGWVRDGAGGPIDGAVVVARADESNSHLPHPAGRGISGYDGRFVITDIDAGSYTVTAAAMAAELSPATAEHVRTGRQDVVLVLGTGGVLTGLVVRADGLPATGLTVQLRKPGPGGTPMVATFYDPDGRYSFPGLPPGPYLLHPMPRGGVPVPEVPVTVPDDGKQPPLVLPSGARLVGRVVEADGGAPIAQARIVLEPPLADPLGAPLVSVTSDPVGQFELGGIPEGMRSIAVYADDHDGQIVSGLQLPAEGTLGPVTIALTLTPPGQRAQRSASSIGASLIPTRDALVLAHVQPLGGAGEAGLVDGDRIVAVEGRPVAALGPAAAIEMVRGPEGTPVRLAVNRPAAGNTVELVVFRRRLVVDVAAP